MRTIKLYLTPRVCCLSSIFFLFLTFHLLSGMSFCFPASDYFFVFLSSRLAFKYFIVHLILFTLFFIFGFFWKISRSFQCFLHYYIYLFFLFLTTFYNFLWFLFTLSLVHFQSFSILAFIRLLFSWKWRSSFSFQYLNLHFHLNITSFMSSAFFQICIILLFLFSPSISSSL